MAKRQRCTHCRTGRRRFRGLCWRCLEDPAVSRRYPAHVNQYGGERNQLLDDRVNMGHQLPARPTSAEPRTKAKIAVMARRAARRQSLFHPLDPGKDLS